MVEKSRSTRWRASLAAQGGKPVGVTLSPAAAVALEAIQGRCNVSQREAISRALEFAASHMGREEAGEVFFPGGRRDSELAHLSACLAEMEGRLGRVEDALAASGFPGHPGQSEFELEAAVPRDDPGIVSTIVGEAADRLVEFSARRMWEFGERVARTRLYELARQEGVPIHDSLPEYSAFISLNMERIRERMRHFK